MNKKNLIIIIVIMVVVVGLVGAGFYYYGYQKGFQQGYGKGVEVGGAAAKVEAAKAVSNPMENMPSTNPFDKVVNPYEEAYKNPFK